MTKFKKITRRNFMDIMEAVATSFSTKLQIQVLVSEGMADESIVEVYNNLKEKKDDNKFRKFEELVKSQYVMYCEDRSIHKAIKEAKNAGVTLPAKLQAIAEKYESAKFTVNENGEPVSTLRGLFCTFYFRFRSKNYECSKEKT